MTTDRWIVVFVLLFAFSASSCMRQSERSDKPSIVRFSEKQVFIISPPSNRPTDPHWLTGKDMEPRYPDTPIEEVPISGQLLTFLDVSKILRRPEMADASQFSKDSVFVKVFRRDFDSNHKSEIVGEWNDYRKSGKPAKILHGLDCYAYTPEGAMHCFSVVDEKTIKIYVPEESTLLPNPGIDIDFETHRFGGAVISAYTSIRNLPYWRSIPEAILDRLDQLSLDNFEKNLRRNNK